MDPNKDILTLTKYRKNLSISKIYEKAFNLNSLILQLRYNKDLRYKSINLDKFIRYVYLPVYEICLFTVETPELFTKTPYPIIYEKTYEQMVLSYREVNKLNKAHSPLDYDFSRQMYLFPNPENLSLNSRSNFNNFKHYSKNIEFKDLNLKFFNLQNIVFYINATGTEKYPYMLLGVKKAILKVPGKSSHKSIKINRLELYDITLNQKIFIDVSFNVRYLLCILRLFNTKNISPILVP